MPRRAVFHRYPFVGRFAAQARQRAYLWSLKPRHVRPAFYLGAIVSLWPLIGFQLPLAFAGSLLLRANIMIAGVLQLVTNPLTAAPIYYFTYRVGKAVLFPSLHTPSEEFEIASSEESMASALESPADLAFGFTDVAAALFVGGTVCGLVLAVAIDLVYLCINEIERRRSAIVAP